MSSRFASLLASITLLVAAAAAHAADVIIYERNDFRGRSVNLQQQASDLQLLGFDNRAASIFVMSGTWEFCTEPNYRGNCRIFAPGEYRDLGNRSNRVASGRLVTGPGQGRNPGERWNNADGARAELFDRENFDGPLATLNGVTPNFDPLGYNDAVGSIIIRRGTWEFCSDANFRGECRTFGPGEYPRLGRGQDDRYSSARPVQATDAGPGPGPRPGNDWNNAGSARAELFDRENFAGPLATLTGVTQNFEPLGYNDAVASIIIRRGTWEFCSDANFRGECRTYGPGEYPRLGSGANDRYSSARPVQGTGTGNNRPQPPVAGRTRIQLFEYANFGGRSITLNGTTTNFEPLGFNDKAESVIVHSGVWILCSDANRGGQCRELRSGQYPTLPGDINSRVSSAYPR